MNVLSVFSGSGQIQPVAFALKRRSGQWQSVALPVVPSFFQRRQPCTSSPGQARLSHTQQGGGWTQLQEEFVAHCRKCVDACCKSHRLPNMTAPVMCIRDLPLLQRSSCQVGKQWNTRGLKPYLACHLLKGIQNGLHERRVEGMGDVQELCVDAPGGKAL